jgi:hypothetical protein
VQGRGQAGLDEAPDELGGRLDLGCHNQMDVLRAILGEQGLHPTVREALRALRIALDAVEDNEA